MRENTELKLRIQIVKPRNVIESTFDYDEPNAVQYEFDKRTVCSIVSERRDRSSLGVQV